MNMNILPVAIIACVSTMAVQAEDMKDVLKDSLSTIESLNTQLDKVKDKATADSTAPEIAKIAKKYADIASRLLKVTPPSDEDAVKAIAEMQTKAQEIMTKFQANMLRIQKEGLMTPELVKAIAQMNPQVPAAK